MPIKSAIHLRLKEAGEFLHNNVKRPVIVSLCKNPILVHVFHFWFIYWIGLQFKISDTFPIHIACNIHELVIVAWGYEFSIDENYLLTVITESSDKPDLKFFNHILVTFILANKFFCQEKHSLIFLIKCLININQRMSRQDTLYNGEYIKPCINKKNYCF